MNELLLKTMGVIFTIVFLFNINPWLLAAAFIVGPVILKLLRA